MDLALTVSLEHNQVLDQCVFPFQLNLDLAKECARQLNVDENDLSLFGNPFDPDGAENALNGDAHDARRKVWLAIGKW